MTIKNTTLVSLLKSHGFSVTNVRLQVLAAFSDHQALTMADLIQRLPNINRASVYRTVGIFEELGILNRLVTGWKYKLELSDLFSEHHHHATCAACGSVTTFRENEALEAALQHITASIGYEISSHTLEIRGTCQNCHKS